MRRKTAAVLPCLLIIALVGAWSRAQAPLDAYELTTPARPELGSEQTLRTFREAERRLFAGEFAEATPLLVELTVSGDAGLVPNAAGNRFRDVSTTVMHLLLSAPAEARVDYLAATNPAADAEFSEIKNSMDPYVLRRFLRKRLLNRSGAEAIARLAAIYAEAGELDAAHLWLSRLAAAPILAADASAEGVWPEIYHPNPPNPAAALAHMAAVSQLMGREARARRELDLLRQLFPGAEGQFGASPGPLADAIVAAQLSQLGGAKSSLEEVDFKAASSPRWQAPLAIESYAPSRLAGGTEAASVATPVFPVVADVGSKPLLLWQDARGLHAVDAVGDPAWPGLEGSLFYADPVQVRLPPWGPLVYAPTVAGERLLARLGSPTTYRPPIFRPEQTGSQIACFDLTAEGRLEWIAPDAERQGEFLADHWAYEGAPTVGDGGVFTVLRRGAARAEAHVERRNLRDGRLLWRRFLCTGDTPGRGQIQEASCNAPTVVGDSVYIGSNLGALFCLDVRDGEVRWATAYPRGVAGRLAQPDGALLRVPSAPLVDAGRVYVAPVDSRRVVAVGAGDGAMLWTSSEEMSEVAYLIGVSDDALVCMGSQASALDSATGAVLWATALNGDDELVGRGVMSNRRLFACTRGGELLALSLDHGEILERRALNLPDGEFGGTLVAFGDQLVVAGNRTISGWDGGGAASP